MGDFFLNGWQFLMFTHFKAIFPSDKAFSLSPAGEKK